MLRHLMFFAEKHADNNIQSFTIQSFWNKRYIISGVLNVILLSA